jgi:hypothetical protein
VEPGRQRGRALVVFEEEPRASAARPKLEARLHLHALDAVAPARRDGRTDQRPALSGRALQTAEGARITTGISRRVVAR